MKLSTSALLGNWSETDVPGRIDGILGVLDMKTEPIFPQSAIPITPGGKKSRGYIPAMNLWLIVVTIRTVCCPYHPKCGGGASPACLQQPHGT